MWYTSVGCVCVCMCVCVCVCVCVCICEGRRVTETFAGGRGQRAWAVWVPGVRQAPVSGGAVRDGAGAGRAAAEGDHARPGT
jgi:hypothetical protein